METHLKIEYLAPYLPYNLKIIGHGKNISVLKYKTEASDLGGISLNGVLEDWHVKPILRPLSDLLNKDLDHWIDIQEVCDIPTEHLIHCIVNNTKYVLDYHLSISVYNFLLKNHFDVFGLIEKGLAIDINTLP